VKAAVGSKPSILGKKLDMAYTVTDTYCEVDINVNSAMVARTIFGTVKSYAKSLVVDLAFIIEGTDSEELPERVLGSVRLHKLDLALFPTLNASDAPELRSEEGEE
jgi:hypothetical protein